MEYKKGDIIVCLPGFNPSDVDTTNFPKGGSGWEDGRLYQVTEPSDSTVWSGGKGMWLQAVRPATDHEVKAYKEGVRYLKDVPIPELTYEIF